MMKLPKVPSVIRSIKMYNYVDLPVTSDNVCKHEGGSSQDLPLVNSIALVKMVDEYVRLSGRDKQI